MPQVINHGSPIASVLANAGGAASDLADFSLQKRHDDALIENAKLRLALEQASNARAQGQYDYNMARAPIEDAQRDTQTKLRNTETEQAIKLRGQQGDLAQTLGQQQIALNERKLNPPADTLGTDSDVELFKQEADKVLTGLDDGPELAKIRQQAQIRADLLRNYGNEEPDPQRRAQLRKVQAQKFLAMTENQALPLMRQKVETELDHALSRGYLATNEKAHAGVEKLMADLRAGGDPRDIHEKYTALAAGVGADEAFLEDAAAAEQEIAGMQALSTSMKFEDKAAMRALIGDVRRGKVKASEAVEKARKLALGGVPTAAEKLAARRQALDELKAENPPTVNQQTGVVEHAKFTRQQIEERARLITGEESPAPAGGSGYHGMGSLDYGGGPDAPGGAVDAGVQGMGETDGEPQTAGMGSQQGGQGTIEPSTPSTRAAVVKRPSAPPEEWDAMVAKLTTIKDPQERIRELYKWPYNPFVAPPGSKSLPTNAPGSVLDKKPEEPGVMDKLKGAANALGGIFSRIRGR